MWIVPFVGNRPLVVADVEAGSAHLFVVSAGFVPGFRLRLRAKLTSCRYFHHRPYKHHIHASILFGKQVFRQGLV